MNNIIVILLIIAIVKFVMIGIVLFAVFRNDLTEMWNGRGEEKKASALPTCMYCQSKWTHPVDNGDLRWDRDELVLVTGYQCDHCQLPFWHVERVPSAPVKR